MNMQRRTVLFGGLGLAATAVLSGCGGDSGSAATDIADASKDFGFKESGLPIVDKELSLKFTGSKSALAPKY